MKKLTTIIFLSSLLFFYGCTAANLNSSNNKIKIGVLIDQSGSLADMGLAVKAALQAGLVDVNKQWAAENLNYSMELVFVDTKGTANGILNEITSLKNQGIRYFIGGISSSEIEAIRAYAQENNLIVISPTSTATRLCLDDTIFRFAIPDSTQIIGTSLLMNNEHITTILPVYIDNLYGQGLYDGFCESSTSGITVAEGVSYPASTTNFSDVIATLNNKLKNILATTAAENVAIYFIGYSEGEQLFEQIQQTANTDLAKVHWYGAEGLVLNGHLKDNTNAAAFAKATNFKLLVHIPPDTADFTDEHLPTTGAVAALKQKIDSYHGSTSLEYNLTSYDIITLLGNILNHTEAQTSNTDFINRLINLSKLTYGFSGQLALDPDTGDRLTGGYGYYQLNSSNTWVLKNTYSLYLTNQPAYLKTL